MLRQQLSQHLDGLAGAAASTAPGGVEQVLAFAPPESTAPQRLVTSLSLLASRSYTQLCALLEWLARGPADPALPAACRACLGAMGTQEYGADAGPAGQQQGDERTADALVSFVGAMLRRHWPDSGKSSGAPTADGSSICPSMHSRPRGR